MKKLKQTLAASALVLAGAAGAASANELTQSQEEAISLARGFNQCVENTYNDPQWQADANAYDTAMNEYYSNLEQFAKDNGFIDQMQEISGKLQTLMMEALSDGVVTPEEESQFTALMEQSSQLEEQFFNDAEANGIVEPALNVEIPEESCEAEMVEKLEADGGSLEQLNKDLEDAYNTLGHYEFMDAIAP